MRISKFGVMSQFTGGYVETSFSFQKENVGDGAPAASTHLFTAHTGGVRKTDTLL